MKKVKKPYDKTVAIWRATKPEREEWKKVVESLGYNVVICESNNELFSTSCFAIIVNAKLLSKGFFLQKRERYTALFEMLESGEVTMLYFNKMGTLRFDPPEHVYNFHDGSELQKQLTECENKIKKFVTQRRLIETQLGRLFYMYAELVKNKQISMPDVMIKASVSRNTFYRDIKFIQQVCPKMKLTGEGSAYKIVEDNETTHYF